MSFENEMNQIANVSTGQSSTYISKPCKGIVTIKNYEKSPTKDFKGCPYFDFTFETQGEEDGSNKASNTSRLYRVRETDSEETKEYKMKRIKELLTNANADFTKKGEEIIKSAIGKEVNALFKEVEYPAVDGDKNNMPIIKTKIEYSFSAKKDQEIKGNQSYYFKELSEKYKLKYEGDLAKWKRDNPKLADNEPGITPNNNFDDKIEKDDVLDFK